MNTTELLSIFRAEVQDAVQPYLWADDLVYGYIDDAQKQFCRDTYGISDARSFKITMKGDGAEWFKLDPRILKIRSAVLAGTGIAIPLVPVEKMEASGLRFDGKNGRVRALITGLEANTVRTVPIPDIAGVVNLVTFRLPDDVGAGDDLEIEPQHQRALLHWVKHKAYDVQDSEMFDKDASGKYLIKHNECCSKALHEQSRAGHTAGTVIYGGI